MVRLKNATKKNIADLYNRVAEQYDLVGPKTFTPMGQILVNEAHLQAGMRILDVGSGRGAILFPAGQALAGQGLVVGIDLACEMIRVTQQDLTGNQAKGVTALTCMDGENLGFARHTFDAILCGFAFFFLDPGKTLVEFARVLKPEGLLAISLVQRGDPRWAWYEKRLIAFHDQHGLPLYTGQRGVGELNQPFAITKELQMEKFKHIQIKIHEMEVRYPDAETWWQSKWTHGARYPLEHIPSNLLSTFHDEMVKRAEKMDLTERWRLACVLAKRE